MGSTNTGSTMLDRLVRDGEFGQVVSDHFRLDFDLVELLARVDTNNASNHLRHNDHVTEVSLDRIGLLVRLGLLLGFAELLDETHGLALQATVESPTRTGMYDIAELFGRKIEELVEVDTTEGKLAEGAALLEFGSLLGIVFGVSHVVTVVR